MISKGSVQSGDFIFGSVTSAALRASNAFLPPSPKSNNTSFCSKLDKGSAILLKFLMPIKPLHGQEKI